MAILDFPDAPQPGEVYVFENITYTWEPPRWTAVSAVVVQGPPGPQGAPGPTDTDEGGYPVI